MEHLHVYPFRSVRDRSRHAPEVDVDVDFDESAAFAPKESNMQIDVDIDVDLTDPTTPYACDNTNHPARSDSNPSSIAPSISPSFSSSRSSQTAESKEAITQMQPTLTPASTPSATPSSAWSSYPSIGSGSFCVPSSSSSSSSLSCRADPRWTIPSRAQLIRQSRHQLQGYTTTGTEVNNKSKRKKRNEETKDTKQPGEWREERLNMTCPTVLPVSSDIVFRCLFSSSF